MNQKKEDQISAKGLLLIFAYVMIVVLAWGSNYPLMKLALRDLEPLTFSLLRLSGGAVVVFFLLKLNNDKNVLPIKQERLPLILISMMQVVSVMGLASVALLYLPAGRTVALIYSMPFWAALFDIAVFRNKPSVAQVTGIVLSLSGLLIYFEPSVLDWQEAGVQLGLFITMFAAILWGLGTVLYRRYDFQTTQLRQTLWQLMVASVVMLGLVFLLEFPLQYQLTPKIILILLWNWLVPTALAVWAWTRLLNLLPGVIAGQLLMLTPFVGIASSALIFDESLPPVFAISFVLITLGGALSLTRKNNVASQG